ncbi:hypothetical protein HDF16_005870 [Granulicella aggregans]|uniref:DUF2934 domain-containing protein n=1 Tax=Granulicella aggregans TaxID=474949 RepID=A0A7W7ZJL2_9BACT|nr:hypothetical protein [Granulicella aggregans]
MGERLVDVANKSGNVIHTYPVTVGKPGSNASNIAFQSKSLDAAVLDHLVPSADVPDLAARMHISRGGPLQPYGDHVPCNSQTKDGIMEAVRGEAYRLWVESGRPEGRSDEFWERAHGARLRWRAYTLWQQGGRPTGNADYFWNRAEEFEKF